MFNLGPIDSAAYSFVLLAVVAMGGLALGSIHIRGLGFGVAGVLFAGLVAGHLGYKLNPVVLQFARDAGLVLFVYSIGSQAGPGFIASLRRSGLKLNFLALSTVVIGCIVALLAKKTFQLPLGAMAGMYSGSVTNTPSMAAAQEVLASRGSPTELVGQAYAVVYPGGVFGIILTMLLAKMVAARNGHEAKTAKVPREESLSTLAIEVSAAEWFGRRLSEALAASGSSAVISRHLSDGKIRAAHRDRHLAQGDILLAVGRQQDLECLCKCIGRASEKDPRAHQSGLSVRRIIVTRRQAQDEIGQVLSGVQGAVATRVRRGDVEFVPSPELQLQFGDIVQVVGEESGIQQATEILGNSARQLDHPQLIPVALGIALGVLLGSIPIHLPGLPVPIKLGLAGGPLIVALVLSRIGRIGPVVWYLPQSANFLMRELGIVVFLACVGVKSGEHFVETLRSGQGGTWILCGLAITLLPLFAMSVMALLMKIRFMTLCGLLAGSMTDPPALAFASALGPTEKAYVAYAAVYPLVMVARVISAQLLVVWGQ
jgi:putative transport protein